MLSLPQRTVISKTFCHYRNTVTISMSFRNTRKYCFLLLFFFFFFFFFVLFYHMIYIAERNTNYDLSRNIILYLCYTKCSSLLFTIDFPKSVQYITDYHKVWLDDHLNAKKKIVSKKNDIDLIMMRVK